MLPVVLCLVVFAFMQGLHRLVGKAFVSGFLDSRSARYSFKTVVTL